MMFRKINFIILFLTGIPFALFAQQQSFSIEGTIKNADGRYIYLMYRQGAPQDSVMINKGRFSFSGMIDGPVEARLLTLKPGERRAMDKSASLYLVPGRMQLSIDYNNFEESIILKGSPVHAEYQILQRDKAGVMAELRPLSTAYNDANMTYIEARRTGKSEEELEKLKNAATAAKDQMDPYNEQLSLIDKAFMDKYPASFVTASMLRYRISSMPLQEGEERYSKIPGSIKNNRLGKEILKELEGLQMGSPGATAYIFASKELRGAPLSLADYKGKYVLVDFWASWCVPCRKGNPHLLSLYSKYKDKGFEIIGISDDDSNPEAWRQAVEKDGIGVWKHILRGLKFDGKEFDRTNDISDHFGIHTLPTKILINPDGIIIGRYGGGGESDDAMDKKLAEIFGS